MNPRSRRAVLRGAAAGVAAFASGCLGAVPGGGGDDPDVTTENAAVKWSVKLSKRVPVPGVGHGLAYATCSDCGVRALDLETGEQRWSSDPGGSAWYGPQVAGGTVLAYDYHEYAALDATTGEQRWSRRFEGSTSATPLVDPDADRVYVCNSDRPTSESSSSYPHDLFALSLADGSVRWKRDLGENDELAGPPVLYDGTLYVQLERSGVFALDPADGTTRWHAPFDGDRRTGGGLSVASGRLLSTAGPFLSALDPGDGTTAWTRSKVNTAPVGADEVVYAGHFNPGNPGPSTVHAFDAATGAERWTKEVPGDLRATSALTAEGDRLYVSYSESAGDRGVEDDRSTLVAYDRDGTERWRFGATGDGLSRVAVADGTVLVGQRLGAERLYALTPEE